MHDVANKWLLFFGDIWISNSSRCSCFKIDMSNISTVYFCPMKAMKDCVEMFFYLCTVESRKFELLWTGRLFRIICNSISSYREVDIKWLTPPKMIIISIKHVLCAY